MGIFQSQASGGVETALSPEQEERLSLIVEALSDCRDSGDRGPLERAIGDNPDLAGPLKELWAAMLITDAVAEQSTIMQSTAMRSEAMRSGGPLRGGDDAVPVEVISTYWHFIDILWIYLLVFLLAVR